MPRASLQKTKETAARLRKRDAAATRAAILKAARQAFAAHGYDGAGLREIAANAGVTAMLVNRYFGSKEGLFEAAIDDAMSDASVIRKGMPDLDALGGYLAAGVLETTRPNATPLDGSLMMVRSGSTTNQRVIEIGRKQIEKMHLKTLAAALKGDNAAERAALILALIAGVQVMRQMIGLTPLARTPSVTLQQLLAPLIQQLVDN